MLSQAVQTLENTLAQNHEIETYSRKESKTELQTDNLILHRQGEKWAVTQHSTRTLWEGALEDLKNQNSCLRADVTVCRFQE